VCFAPKEDCTAFAVDAIDAAEREILVSAWSLSKLLVSIGNGDPNNGSLALASASRQQTRGIVRLKWDA
jgi:hypothetical protein